MKTKGLIVGFRAKTTIGSKFEGNNKLAHHSFFSGELGYGSYIGANSVIVGKVGRYCSIGENVVCLGSTHPTSRFVSSHPAFYSLKKQSGFTYTHKQLFNEHPKIPNTDESIIIGNDVYIGFGVTIVAPVVIGDGSIIAANATVVKDVAPYSIVGGVPAKFIKKRFKDEEIEFLLNYKWWNKPNEWVVSHSSDFIDIEHFIENNKDS